MIGVLVCVLVLAAVWVVAWWERRSLRRLPGRPARETWERAQKKPRRP